MRLAQHTMQPILLVSLALLAAAVASLYLYSQRRPARLQPHQRLQSFPSVAAADDRKHKARHAHQPHQRKVDITAKVAAAPSAAEAAAGSSSPPLLLRRLRGHSEDVTSASFSLSPPWLLLTTSKDRTFRVWLLSDDVAEAAGGAGKQQPAYVQQRLQGEWASASCWGGERLWLALADTRRVQCWHVRSEQDGRLSLAFSHGFSTAHKEPITALHLLGPAANAAHPSAASSASPLLLTLARGLDTHVHLYAPSGSLSRTLNIAQIVNYDCQPSPDRRFFAVATRLTDCKLFELSGRGAGGVEQVMALKGHARSVQSLCFPSARTACTLTADGLLQLWSIDVRYAQGEDTRRLWTVDTGLGAAVESVRAADGLIVVSGGGREAGGRVQLYSSESGQLLQELLQVGGKWGIGGLEMRADGKRMASFGLSSRTIELWATPQQPSRHQQH